MRTAFAVGDFIRRCGDNFPKGEGREHSPPSLPLWGRWLSEARSDEVGSAAREVKYGNVQPEGVKGAIGKPPCRLRRGEIPCFRERATMVARPAIRSRPSGATQHRCWVEQLGGAPAGARSYWQGRFAACAFVERVWRNGRPWNSWGVAPNPTRGAASGLRKGHCPLTLFRD